MLKDKALAALPYRPCAGVCLTNAEGLVFAGKRIDNPGPAWQMPQGGIDPGERPMEAALRELFEETGLMAHHVTLLQESTDWLRYDLPEALIPQIWGGRYRGQEQKWALMRLLADESAINIATQTPEFSAWQWMEAADLLESIVPFKRAIYHAVLSEFGLL